MLFCILTTTVCEDAYGTDYQPQQSAAGSHEKTVKKPLLPAYLQRGHLRRSEAAGGGHPVAGAPDSGGAD